MSYLCLTLKHPKKIACHKGFLAENLHITLFHFPWDDVELYEEVMKIVVKSLPKLKLNKTARGRSINYYGTDNKFVVLEIDSKWIVNLRNLISEELRKTQIIYSTQYKFSPHITLGKNGEVDMDNCNKLVGKKMSLNRIDFCNRDGILGVIIL